MKKRRSHQETNSLGRGALAGAIAGGVASWVKSLAEPPLQRWGEELFPPQPAEKIQRGADVSGHPENMPNAVLAQETSEAIQHHPLSSHKREEASTTIHYAFGIAVAAGYGLLAEKYPVVTTGGGLLAGAALWASTHGSTIPALGLQAPVKQMPKAWYVWELGSHLVYGLATETVRRGLRRWVV